MPCHVSFFFPIVLSEGLTFIKLTLQIDFYSTGGLCHLLQRNATDIELALDNIFSDYYKLGNSGHVA